MSIKPSQTKKDSSRLAQTRSTSYYRQRLAWSIIFLLLVFPLVFYLIYQDVGELDSDVWMSFSVFGLITIALAIYTLRLAGGSWQGELVEKAKSTKGVRLFFRTNRGKLVQVVVGSKLADYFDIGDQVIKIRGYDYPEKIRRDGKLQLCVACGNTYPQSEKRCHGCRYPAIDPGDYV